MNYLAHLYLSGESDELLIGNFIGDSVKGKQYLHYAKEVQRGVILHRQIDLFTDSHPLVKQCSHRFRQHYGRYSGIVSDIVFDHFLAKYWPAYSVYSLPWFSGHVHAVLLSHFSGLPLKVKSFLPFFIKQKRLESYAQFEGIRQTLEIMGRRTSMPEESEFAMNVLYEEFFLIKAAFDEFFFELIRFVESSFGVEIKRPVRQGLCVGTVPVRANS